MMLYEKEKLLANRRIAGVIPIYSFSAIGLENSGHNYKINF